MDFLLWIVVGGLLGWFAGKVMSADAPQGVLLDVVAGIAGALLAGFVLSPLLGDATIDARDLSAASLLISLPGAVILLAVVNLVRDEAGLAT